MTTDNQITPTRWPVVATSWHNSPLQKGIFSGWSLGWRVQSPVTTFNDLNKSLKCWDTPTRILVNPFWILFFFAFGLWLDGTSNMLLSVAVLCQVNIYPYQSNLTRSGDTMTSSSTMKWCALITLIEHFLSKHAYKREIVCTLELGCCLLEMNNFMGLIGTSSLIHQHSPHVLYMLSLWTHKSKCSMDQTCMIGYHIGVVKTWPNTTWNGGQWEVKPRRCVVSAV